MSSSSSSTNLSFVPEDVYPVPPEFTVIVRTVPPFVSAVSFAPVPDPVI